MFQGYSAQASPNFALKRNLQSKHSKDDCNQLDKILKKNKSFGIISIFIEKSASAGAGAIIKK